MYSKTNVGTMVPGVVPHDGEKPLGIEIWHDLSFLPPRDVFIPTFHPIPRVPVRKQGMGIGDNAHRKTPAMATGINVHQSMLQTELGIADQQRANCTNPDAKSLTGTGGDPTSPCKIWASDKPPLEKLVGHTDLSPPTLTEVFNL